MANPDVVQLQAAAEPAAVEITPHRYEMKIPLPAAWLSDVNAWVRVHPAHWRRSYPPRQINNIYFDTPRLDALNANFGGIGERAKLRLRWYGDLVARVADARLELKRKRGMVGWKEILPLDVNLDLSNFDWQQLAAALAGGVGPAARHWLRLYPLPVVINCYRRDYYVTPDEVLRLTVDRNLRAYGQRASRVPNLSLPASLVDEIVVEVKAPTDTDAVKRLNDALSYFPASVGRFSKYVQGVLAAPDLL